MAKSACPSLPKRLASDDQSMAPGVGSDDGECSGIQRDIGKQLIDVERAGSISVKIREYSRRSGRLYADKSQPEKGTLFWCEGAFQVLNGCCGGAAGDLYFLKRDQSITISVQEPMDGLRTSRGRVAITDNARLGDLLFKVIIGQSRGQKCRKGQENRYPSKDVVRL